MHIDIMMNTDSNYAVYTRVAIWSARLHTDSEVRLSFTILCDSSLSEDARKFIIEVTDFLSNIEVSFHDVNERDFLGTKAIQVPMAAYYRLIATRVLDCDKCIYLDGDLIVETDLLELYEIDLEDNYVAGIKDMNCSMYPNRAVALIDECRLEDFSDHINAGVLLFNLKKIRDDGLTEIFLEEMKNHTKFQDQDVINRVCHGKIKLIDWTFNHITRYSEHIYESQLGRTERNGKGGIYHYATPFKPVDYTATKYAKHWWGMAKKALPTAVYEKIYLRAKKNSDELFASEITKKCNDAEAVVLAGYSDIGVYIQTSLFLAGFSGAVIFCDNSRDKLRLKLTENVCSVEEAAEKYPNAIWINTVQKEKEIIRNQICSLGVCSDRIIDYHFIPFDWFDLLDKEYFKKGIEERSQAK